MLRHQRRTVNVVRPLALLPIALVVIGCSEPPERGLTSKQTDQMLQVQQKLAAEREVVAAEHAAIGRARDRLEEDRKALAKRERREPIIADSIRTAGLMVACSAPIALLVIVLFVCRPEPTFDGSDDQTLELLLDAAYDTSVPRPPSPMAIESRRLTDQRRNHT